MPSADTPTDDGPLRRRFTRLLRLRRAVVLVWQAAPGWTAAWAVLLVVQGLLPVATVYLTRTLVDSLVMVIDSGGDQQALQRSLVLGRIEQQRKEPTALVLICHQA